MSKPKQSSGRDRNAAQPPGERPGLVSPKGVVDTGRRSQQSAGPDGPSAGAVGETFKRKP